MNPSQICSRLSVAWLLASVASHAAFAAPIEFYGFLRATSAVASRALDSFGNTNLSAPIKATPTITTSEDAPRTSLQFAQSRFGFMIQSGELASGQLELDLIDFAKADPGTKAVPRVRIARMRIKLTESGELRLGQDWDTFSPMKPATRNPVGLFFQAGNAGFMRPQIQWHQSFVGFEWEIAVGLAGSNPTVNDGPLEQNLLPSLATHFTYKASSKTQCGLSAIAGRAQFGPQPAAQYGSFFGLSAFGEHTPWQGAVLKAESYFGENLGNTGALTLAYAATPASIHEFGAYVSLEQSVTESLRALAGIGLASILRDSGSPIQILNGGATTLSIKSNAKASIAITYSLAKNFELFSEESIYLTEYRDTTLVPSSYTGLLWESGAVYNF